MQAIKDIFKLPRSALAILFALLLINMGSFSIIPYLSIYLIREIGITLAQAGIILTTKVACQRGLIIIGGIVTDRKGPRMTIVIGSIVRIASYILFACFHDFSFLLLAAALLGASAALFIPATKKALSAMVGEDKQFYIFSVRNTANNMGVALGGIVGAFWMSDYPLLVFTGAAVLQLGNLIIFLALTRSENLRTRATETVQIAMPRYALVNSFKKILKAKRIFYLFGVTLVFYMLEIQIEFLLPVFVEHAFSKQMVGMLFVVNAIVIILFQIHYAAGTRKYLSQEEIISLGFFLIAVAFWGFAMSNTVIGFIFMVVAFTFGCISIDPGVDSITGSIVPKQYAGTAFGMVGLFAFIGASIGNNLGSLLYDWLVSKKVFWMICGAVSVLALIISLGPVLYKRKIIERLSLLYTKGG